MNGNIEDGINSIVSNIVTLILDPILYGLVVLSMVYFFWGLTIYILNADDQGERTKGKNHMIWGVIGLVIIFSVMGIMSFVDNTVQSIFN